MERRRVGDDGKDAVAAPEPMKVSTSFCTHGLAAALGEQMMMSAALSLSPTSMRSPRWPAGNSSRSRNTG